ncbi:MAG TPA: galactose oxidase-like domain-containing protein [Propionibacteriaceae bacterium]|nr:galactose oxidase-like domain-containing protein [Propionibacteriaceae bacterium]
MKRHTLLRLRNRALVAITAGAVIAVNYPHVSSGVQLAGTRLAEAQPSYKKSNGHWSTVQLPAKYRVNGIHTVLLPTGKVLIVSGSGNNTHHFEAGSFESVLWNPADDSYRKIDTPVDLFCGGHAFLPDGNVLIAGGTKKYEVLGKDVTHAAGVITVGNDAIYERNTELKVGDTFTDRATGLKYRSTEDKIIPPVRKNGDGTKTPTLTKVWVEAVEPDKSYAFRGKGHEFTWDGHNQKGLYGKADTIVLDKQEYRGLDDAYIFDIRAESYIKADSMTKARWYPSLVSVDGGDVLAVSGLDEYGVFIDDGQGTTEVFDVKTKTWRARPDLNRPFPTYPALMRGADGRILYTGANAGYGPAERMRTPGIWNLKNNSFVTIPGLRDPKMNETAGSVLLPPAQNQDGLIVGGGNVGDAAGSTARADRISFNDRKITAAPDLQQPVRYPSVVNLPTDQVLITGGSRDYRGRGASDVLAASLYDPKANTMAAVAPPHVGRNYHSEALLLPDGSVLSLGSDPLYGDAENLIGGTFEQRLEIYRPPYFFTEGERPKILHTPSVFRRGSSIDVAASGNIGAARLIRPSAVTHVTDTEQRSVALGVRKSANGVRLTLDANRNLTPSGWYMLFVLDRNGKPSTASWVQVP